jgi:branched-chain amino acid transport system permease protein
MRGPQRRTLWGPVVGTVLLEATSALLQSWLGSGHGGVQLTVYALILIAVILWRPSGLLGVLTNAYAHIVQARPAHFPQAAEAKRLRHEQAPP